MTTESAAARGEACAVCRSADARPWRTATDNLLGGEEKFSAVRCQQCGTARLQPRPTDMGRFYTPATYARAEDDQTGLARRLDLFFRRQADRAITALGDSAPPRGGNLLDVGCGDGRFLAAMKARGWTGQGIETDAVAADLARRRTRMTVSEAPIESAGVPESAFDVVSLLHVLEHVSDPRTTLLAARAALRPGGTLLVAVPNIACLESAVFRSSWYPLDLPRHYWGFAPQSLTRLLIECGFSKPTIRFLPLFFLPQSLRYVVRALRGRSTPTAQALSGPQADTGSRTRFFSALLRFSEGLGRFVPGEVMELAARKPRDSSALRAAQ